MMVRSGESQDGLASVGEGELESSGVVESPIKYEGTC